MKSSTKPKPLRISQDVQIQLVLDGKNLLGIDAVEIQGPILVASTMDTPN